MTGHQRGLEVANLPGPAGWFATCECGWLGTVTATQDEARETHMQHARKAATR